MESAYRIDPTVADEKEEHIVIFGMKPFTFLHVALSLVGIGAGIVVMWGLLGGKPLDIWTAIFLLTTVLTSATGFGFPFERFLPSHGVGILSLIVLAAAILGRYAFQLAGAWCWIYVIGAVVAEYLNVFVLIAQAFLKVPALKAMAPTQSERPFVITQAVVLLIFVLLAVVAAVRFCNEAVRTA
jgi:hypothetical protein